MFATLCGFIPRDPDYPQRTRQLDVLGRVLDGTLHDVLPYDFHDERNAAGEYVPLRQRRPSVRYPLARIVVEDSLALLFGDGHFPTLDCGDRDVRGWLGEIAKDAALNQVMMEAALRGSVGSVAVVLRVLGGAGVFCRAAEPVSDTGIRPAGAGYTALGDRALQGAGAGVGSAGL